MVQQGTVLQGGGLQHDRKFAICDEQGRFVNGKRYPSVHQLRAAFDPSFENVSLQIQGKTQAQTFHLNDDRLNLEVWLSQYFGFKVKLLQNSSTGFPDDTDASGPTIISTATLTEVATWFPQLSLDEMRLRFRANLEIEAVPPFWEDQLFAEADSNVQFRVGAVSFEGVNPCQRCIVPTRDPLTGEVYPNFTQTFIEKRKETLPSWVPVSQFNHFYRLSVNTRLLQSESNRKIYVGDNVTILDADQTDLDLEQ